nr:MAG TPA: hypothetical protein [Caudoviricetes sp.]
MLCCVIILDNEQHKFDTYVLEQHIAPPTIRSPTGGA